MKRTQHRQLKYFTWRHFLITTAIILILGVGTWGFYQVTQMHEAEAAHPETQDALDQIDQNVFLEDNDHAVSANHQLEKAGFTGTALLVENNRIILQKGYGYANEAEDRFNNPQSLFQIASIQKSFTATLIMQQVQQGKLSLETLLARYYPNVPNARRITIKQLLTMTSGLSQTGEDQSVISELDNVNFDASHVKLLPSNRWTYQAINFRLLAGILMKITHQSYWELFNNVFNKQYHLNIANYENFMHSEHRTIAYQNGNIVPDNPRQYARETGTGNVAMSAGMLYRYYRLLIDHKIITVSRLHDMWQPVVGESYSSGLYHWGKYNSGHGILDGFEPTIVITNNGRSAVILLSNSRVRGKSWQPLAKALFTQMTAIKTR